MWLDAGTTTVLPRGLFDTDGRCHRWVQLRPLTGWQEAAVVESLDPTDLLAQVVASIGDYASVTREQVEHLSRGDRQYLFLQLRAALLGDRIPLVVQCANPSCGEQADVDLRVSEITPEFDTPDQEVHRVEHGGHVCWLRDPSAADDRYAASVAERNAQVGRLWSRIVVEVDGNPLSPGAWWELPFELRQHLALARAQASRAPDLDFLAGCPSCKAVLEFHVDPHAMLAQELRAGGRRLAAEVHTLALHYHWSEADILSLPRGRRWTYLELIERHFSGGAQGRWN